MTDLTEAMRAPFPPNEIEWRVGSTNADKTSGIALAYVTARHIMDRLDQTVGSTNWQDRYEFHGARTVCYLSVRLDGEWITKADGAGDSDVEAEKGAISDALKRAAVKFGIGRYLYDLGKIWVDLEPAGRSQKIKQNQYLKLEKALNDLISGGLVPARTPKVRTVAEEKAKYEELKAEMHQISADGSKALSKWVNDPSVLADINSLERYGNELKREFKELHGLAVVAEKDEKPGYVAPDFESLQSEHHGDRP